MDRAPATLRPDGAPRQITVPPHVAPPRGRNPETAAGSEPGDVWAGSRLRDFSGTTKDPAEDGRAGGRGIAGALEPVRDRIDVAFVFGSLARGEGTAESDVDVMIVGDVGLRELVPMVGEATGPLGREVNAVTMAPEELRERLAAAEPFATHVLDGPMIFIVGGEDALERIAQAG